MNDTIQNFLVALSQIEDRDFNIPMGDNYDEVRTYENNFVTKLNENYAILCRGNQIVEPLGLTRQFQLPKTYIFANNPLPSIAMGYNRLKIELGENVDDLNELTMIPDFIIHLSQSDRQDINQRFIAEVKTEANLTYRKFIFDFFKLNIYIEDFNFQNAAFLSINTNWNVIREYVNKYVNNIGFYTRRVENLYIVNVERFGCEPNCMSLAEILQST